MSCRRVKERLSLCGSAARVATIRSLAGAWITGSSASVPIGASLYERRSGLPAAAAYPMTAMNRAGEHQREMTSQSELGVTVERHPSSLSSVSPGRPTASKEGRIDPLSSSQPLWAGHLDALVGLTTHHLLHAAAVGVTLAAWTSVLVLAGITFVARRDVT
jgi:hypothetical protein